MFDVESVVLASICNVKRPKVQHSKDSKGVNHSETMKYIFALTDDKHSKSAGPHLTWGLDFNQGQNAALIHKIIFRRDYFVIWMRHISILSHKVMWPQIFLYVRQKYRNASSQNSYCTGNLVQNMKRMMSTAANQEKKNEAIKPQFDSELLPEHILWGGGGELGSARPQQDTFSWLQQRSRGGFFLFAPPGWSRLLLQD